MTGHHLRLFVTGAVLLAMASSGLAQEPLVQIYLVRHPETDPAPADPKAISLSADGRQRAALLVPTLAGVRVSHLFASHTVRTRETLDELARDRSLPVVQLQTPGGMLNGQPVTDATSRREAIEPISKALLGLKPGSTAVVGLNSENIFAVLNRLGVPDPAGFVDRLPQRVILDEVQRVPSLFTALKVAVDRRREPGRFLLTGSANVLLVPRLADSLAGRMEIRRLYPLAQTELAKRESTFIATLLNAAFTTRRTARLAGDLAERIAAGGYPAALVRATGRRRAAWYRDYLDAIVQRDVRDLARIGALDALPRLLALTASQTARLLNVSELAAPFSVSRPTIRDYVTLLQRVFLLEELPPWHTNRSSRLVKTPKLHIGDAGLACAVLGVDAAALNADRALLGQLLETFVFQELRRQASWHSEPVSFFHFRDRDDYEVDIVIEQGARGIAGVEVKASATVTASDFRGLRKLKDAAGRRFTGGVVLYDSETAASFGEGLYAVPIRALWETTT